MPNEPRMKFLISPGLPRSGTTYLYHQLAVINREAFNTPITKETNMFWRKDNLDVMLPELFHHPYDPDKYFVDFSPSYLQGQPHAIDRIVELSKFHEVKVVLHLRNPVVQAFSHYVHDVSAHVSRLEFGADPSYFFWEQKSLSRYLVRRAHLIRKLVDAVGRRNVLVVNIHCDIPNTENFTGRVEDFVGVTLKPFMTTKIGEGMWLPYYLTAIDKPLEFYQGNEVRLIPNRTALLVNGELSQIWRNIDELFSTTLLRGQSSWTRRLDLAQCAVLYDKFFKHDFEQTLSILEENPEHYPPCREVEAVFPVLDNAIMRELTLRCGVAEYLARTRQRD